MIDEREWRMRQTIRCLMLTLMLCFLPSPLSALWTLLSSAPPAAAETEGDVLAVFGDDMLFYTLATGPTMEPVTSPAPPDRSLRVEVIRDTPQPAPTSGYRILIYHTHTWEAYKQVASRPYQETEKWRTSDNSANVVAVGEALANVLRALGCTVVHDTTAFEPPNLDAAYQRSLAMLEKRLAAGEAYDLYLDVHRDALSSQSTIKRTVNIGGEEVARFMVLVGKGSGSSFDVKPDWEANYALAQDITGSLNSLCSGLARDVNVKSGRYNQHVAPHCVLLECGNNENTLEQVLAGIPYLAQALIDALAQCAP